MVFGIEVLCKIVRKIFFSWLPRDIEVVSGNLVGHPEEVLFHSSRPLLLDCVIRNGGGRAVVAMYWRGWLLMS